MGGRKQIFLVVLMLLSGFAGGIFSNFLFLRGAQATNKVEKEITAQAFNLVDKHGKYRGGLTFSRDGCPAVGFVNESGNVVAYFGLAATGPMIAFHDNKNRMRLALGLNDDGSQDLIFCDDIKKPRLIMAMGKTGDPGIMLFDKENTLRLIMDIRDKSSLIGFMDGTKNIDLLLSNRPDGQGGMVMQNKHGQIVLGMYNNAPVLSLKKGDGTESITGFFPTGQPFTGLRENGKTIWIAPQGKQAEMQEITPSSDWQKITDSLLQQPKF